MSTSVILAFIAALLALYIICKLFTLPIRLFFKLLYNGIIGGVLLWVVNFIGAYVHFSVPLNPLTAVIAGFCGLPGVAAIILYQIFTK